MERDRKKESRVERALINIVRVPGLLPKLRAMVYVFLKLHNLKDSLTIWVTFLKEEEKKIEAQGVRKHRLFFYLW